MDINRYSPCYGVGHKHLTKLFDYSTEELFELIYATKAMKDKFIAHENTAILNGITIAMMFGDTSMRTRSALEIGIRQLGSECVNLPYSERDMHAGENIKDVVNVIARYGVGAIVTRGIKQDLLDDYTAVSPMPIINSTNEYANPMQAICDLYTIWEKKRTLEGLKLAYIGKGTSTGASLIIGAERCGMQVSVATPSDFNGDKQHKLAELCKDVYFTDEPLVAAKNADIIYTDSYSYHSQLSKEQAEILQPYKIDFTIMSAAAPSALFMHPLPAKRGREVISEVIDGKSSIVYDQAENKLHTIKAILALLIA